MKFNNIRLLVNDFDKCFSFYNDILELECTWGEIGDNYASFNIGLPSGLALFKAELMENAIHKAESGLKQNLHDKFVIIVQVDNIDEKYESLQIRGVEFLTAPKDMVAWGIRVAHFRDPENNLIEIFSELPKK